ncbi:MAG TPA: NAD(P)H-quinone oxidoreductase [Rhizomicrobium sp.]|jgi:NADPH2:quinone reductase|nr:NAD(P)H-quinone oxidoreductase [Rhizomicrobium sp.]
MHAIQVEDPGPDYRLTIADGPRPIPDAGEVLIKVHAAGLNRADLLQARGLYPPPKGASAILGMEVSGEVVEAAPGTDACGIGDKVCALVTGGGYAEFCAAPVRCVLPVPNGIDILCAAALPEALFTVWTNLMDSARLQPGESVLVHGGSSGIGTTAIQLCTALGHAVYATAGSREKCAACEKLGAVQAINYKSEDFVEAVLQATDGRGADVILDMVGGDYIERNFRALARQGRLVNIAFQKGATAEVNFAPMLLKRLSFMATTLRGRSTDEKGRIRDAIAARVWPLIEQGRIRPVIDRVFPLAEAQLAHQRMASSAHIGKILLRV